MMPEPSEIRILDGGDFDTARAMTVMMMRPLRCSPKSRLR